MTHSGGKPHAVGDRGQRYEITVYDQVAKKRIVIGWHNDKDVADRWAKALVTRPTWTEAKVEDRQRKVKP